MTFVSVGEREKDAHGCCEQIANAIGQSGAKFSKSLGTKLNWKFGMRGRTSGYSALDQHDGLSGQVQLKAICNYSDGMGGGFDFVGIRKGVGGAHVRVGEHRSSCFGCASSTGKPNPQ